jgi:hypothetical protein
MSVLGRLERLDRRWIFLAMFLVVSGPILYMGLTGKLFPEKVTATTQSVFDAVEAVPPGERVLFAFDFDPASAGELQPMATQLLRHCAARKLRVVCIALWPLGNNLAEDTITEVIHADFPQMRDGVDYVNLGFQAGQEQLMTLLTTNFRKGFPVDQRGRDTADLEILEGVRSVTDFPLLIDVGAGFPGSKEWVQYVVTGSGGKLRMVAGTTGVSTPQLIPYYPHQLAGILAGMKGAAEYESLVNAKIGGTPPPRYLEAQRRMGPQLFGHLLLVALIVLGNVIHFTRKARAAA